MMKKQSRLLCFFQFPHTMKNLLLSIFLFFILLLLSFQTRAAHIVGADLSYTCLNPILHTYEIRLRLYRDCAGGGAQFDDPVPIFIFRGSTGQTQTVLNISLPTNQPQIVPPNWSACTNQPYTLCVEYADYVGTVSLPPRVGGYNVGWARCCRNNISTNIPNGQGLSVTAHIPGTDEIGTACNTMATFNNLPPQFLCANEAFNFDHSATDPDGDSLVYYVCPPYTGLNGNGQGVSTGGFGNPPPALSVGGGNPNPMGPPPYNLLNYSNPYTWQNPFGNNMFSLDQFSGQLNVTPSNLGTFVFALCVDEYRNGVKINTNKRDFQITVINCINQGQPPSNTSNIGGISSSSNDTIYLNPQDSICYPVELAGSTIGDSVVLFPVSGIFGIGNSLPPPLATLITSTPNPNQDTVRGEICWTAGCNYAGDTLLFITGGNNLSDCFGFNQAFDTVVVVVSGAAIPTISHSGLGGTGDSITVNPNQSINYNLVARETDPLDSLIVFSQSAPAGVVLSVVPQGPRDATGTVNWTPGCNDAGQTFNLIMAARDTNACRNHNVVFDTVTVTVSPLPMVDLMPLAPEICIFDSVQLTASASAPVTYSWSPTTGLSNPNIANPMASPDTTTTYTVTYTDANNCTQSLSVTVQVNNLPVITITPDTHYCPGIPVGLLATGGDAYVWSPAAGLSATNIANPFASPDDTTLYTVTVTDTNACINTADVLVTTMEISAGTDATICNLDSTALTATGGVMYSWAPTGAVANPNAANTNAAPGASTDYVVTITDNNGCVDTDTVSILVNPLPVITMSPDTQMCIFDTITIRASGGTMYQWNADPTLLATNIATPMVNPQATTTYYVTVTDANNCSSMDSVLVTVNPLPVITAANDTAKCGEVGVQIGAIGGVNYQWFPSTGLSNPFLPRPIANPDSSTTYYVIGVDANQCANIDSMFVRVMHADAGPDQAICIGDTTQLLAGGGISYTWNVDPDLVGINITNPTVFPTVTKDFVVTVEDTTGCFDTDTVRVVVNPLPTITVTNPDPYVCSGGATQLTATGGVTYTWRADSTLSATNIPNPIASPLNLTANLVDSSWYYVTVVDSNGCVNNDSIGIEVRFLPIVSASNDTFACPGTVVPISASGGISVSWSPITGLSNPNAAITIVNIDTTTRYTATVTAVWGCADTVSVLVDVINPQAGEDTTICFGDSAQLAASGGVIYRWSPLMGLSDSTISNPKASPRFTTTYIVAVTDSNGCEDMDTMTVFVNQLPLGDAGADRPLCIFDTTTLVATGGSIYNWDPSPFLSATNTATVQAFPNVTSTFYVTITDTNTCTMRDSVVITVNPLPIVDAGPDTTKCGEPGIQLQATGGVSYIWFPTDSLSDPNIANPIATPTDTTTYYVLATDANGCRNVDSVKISTMFATSTPGGTICFGDSIGLVALGGIGYSWTPAASLSYPGRSRTMAGPDTSTRYIVTVLDPSGCTDTANAYVEVLPAPPAEAGPDTSVCLGLSVQLIASGGVSYAWDADTTLSALNVANPTATPVDTNIYYVTVTGANGCTWRDSVQVDVHPLPVANAGVDDTICVFLSTTLNGSGATHFNWNNGLTLSDDTIANPVASPQITTDYILTVTDDNGCQDMDTVRVVVNPLPMADAGRDTGICIGIPLQMMATGGVFYAWDPDPALSNPLISNPVANPLDTTTFYVTVVDSNGCINRDSILVDVYPLPIADAGPDTVVCLGGSIQLTASGGITYIWQPDPSLDVPFGPNPTATPTDTTTYYVLVGDVLGCVNVDSVTLDIHPLPTPEAGMNAEICFGDSIQLDASASMGTNPLSFAWNNGLTLTDDSIVNPIAFPQASTTYLLTVTDVYGCQEVDSVSIVVNPLPPADAGTDVEICFEDSTQLMASGGLFYVWDAHPALSNLNIADPMAGPSDTTTFFVTVTDDKGCSARDSVTVLVKPLPTADAGLDTEICFGDNTQLGATGGVSFVWTPAAGLSATNIADPVAMPDITTRYYVTVTDARQCSNIDSVLITVNPLPVLQTSPDTTICEGFSANLRVNGALNYLWSPGLTLSNPIIANPVASPVTTTRFYVVGTDGNGCVNRDSVQVYVIPKPDITGTLGDSICIYDFADLTVEGGFTALWSTGETDFTITVDPKTTSTYWAIVFDGDGCPSDTFYSTVFVAEERPRAFFEAVPQEIFPGDSVTFIDLSTGATKYRWTFGDGGIDSVAGPVHTYLEPGQYTPTLWVDNDIGCPDSIAIPFVEVLEAAIYWPNAFSPNGDDINDFFYIPSGGYERMDIQIFDRWGKVVFQSSDPGFRWYGTKNGVSVPEGVYVFGMTAVTYDGKRIERSGTITLIR
jgi:gliding motility-associated-like protein